MIPKKSYNGELLTAADRCKNQSFAAVKCSSVENSQFFDLPFFSYYDVILKVFDLQRCIIYQKIAF